MLKLIQSEFKKIFKSKLHCLLLILLACYTMFTTYQVYHDVTWNNAFDETWTFTSKDGDTIQPGLAFYKYADQELHQYARSDTSNLYADMQSKYQKLMQTYPRKLEYDDSYMRQKYGDQYQALVEGFADGTYTESDLWEMVPPTTKSVVYDTVDDKNYLAVFTENDHVRSLYQYIYNNYAVSDSLNPHTDPLFQTLQREDLKAFCANDNVKINLLLDNQNKTEQKIIEQLAEKTAYPTFDSIVGNTLLVNAMQKINIVTLVILVILLSATFAMESYYKTDQILIPSKMGIKIASAKILSGLSLGVLLLIGQYLIILIVSFYYLPPRNLNVLTMTFANLHTYGVSDFLFTYKNIIGNGILLNLTAVCATAMLTMLSSYACKSCFASVVIVLLLLLITTFFAVFQSWLSLGILDQFLPGNMMKTNVFFNIARDETSLAFPYFLVGDTLIAWKNIIIIFWIVLCSGMYMGIRQCARRHKVSTR